jgi:hypothetical protein
MNDARKHRECHWQRVHVSSDRSILRQHGAQGAILRELRPQPGHGFRQPMPGRRQLHERREVVLIGRHSQTQTDGSRIDAPRVQVMEIVQHARAQGDVERGEVCDRRWRGSQVRHQPIELSDRVIRGFQPIVRRATKDRQGVPRVETWSARRVDPERQMIAAPVEVS